MSTSNKIFLAAIILCLGAFFGRDIAQLPEPSTSHFTLAAATGHPGSSAGQSGIIYSSVS